MHFAGRKTRRLWNGQEGSRGRCLQWKTLDQTFNSQICCRRFSAVEKTDQISHFLVAKVCSFAVCLFRWASYGCVVCFPIFCNVLLMRFCVGLFRASVSKVLQRCWGNGQGKWAEVGIGRWEQGQTASTFPSLNKLGLRMCLSYTLYRKAPA